MIIDLINQVNNRYDRTLRKYLEPQNNATKSKVWGSWRTFTPNERYAEESRLDVENWERFKRTGGVGMSKAAVARALVVQANGGVHWHDPSPKWGPDDRKFRKPVAPSSSAIGQLSYNNRNNAVFFKFRTKNGLSAKTYSAIMQPNQLFRWLSSKSMGRYFNQRLKGRM